MTKKDRKTDEKRLQKSKPARSLNPFEEMEHLFEGWHPGTQPAETEAVNAQDGGNRLKQRKHGQLFVTTCKRTK